MIGRLRGRFLSLSDNVVLLDVQGVGYEVEVPAASIDAVPGADLVLFTHLVVREDAQLLYGFEAAAARDLFRNLIRLSGVGPKMALAILGTFTGLELSRVVRDDDCRALQTVPGVGKKTAERLLVELRTRAELLPAPPPEALPAATPAGNPTGQAGAEVEQALISLGYKPQYASQVVARVTAGDNAPLDAQALLRAALQYLGQQSEVRG